MIQSQLWTRGEEVKQCKHTRGRRMWMVTHSGRGGALGWRRAEQRGCARPARALRGGERALPRDALHERRPLPDGPHLPGVSEEDAETRWRTIHILHSGLINVIQNPLNLQYTVFNLFSPSVSADVICGLALMWKFTYMYVWHLTWEMAGREVAWFLYCSSMPNATKRGWGNNLKKFKSHRPLLISIEPLFCSTTTNNNNSNNNNCSTKPASYHHRKLRYRFRGPGVLCRSISGSHGRSQVSGTVDAVPYEKQDCEGWGYCKTVGNWG